MAKESSLYLKRMIFYWFLKILKILFEIACNLIPDDVIMTSSQCNHLCIRVVACCNFDEDWSLQSYRNCVLKLCTKSMQKRPNPENYTFKVTWFCRKQKHIYEILFDILTLGYISSKITDWKICDFFFFLPVIFDRS